MPRRKKKRSPSPAAAGRGKARPAPARRARSKLDRIHKLILRLGRTLIGVLPRARRIPAANDPEA